MNKNEMIVMLKYSIARNRAMGNGVKCQSLMRELNRVQNNQCLHRQAN